MERTDKIDVLMEIASLVVGVLMEVASLEVGNSINESSEIVKCKQTDEKIRYVGSWKKSIPGKGNSMC